MNLQTSDIEGKTFEEKINNWLNEVANECHKMAIQPDFDVDFYVFQSDIPKKPNPKLLILGINPGNFVSYKKKLKEKGIERRTEKDLAQGINTYSRKPFWEWESGEQGNDRMRNVLVGKQFKDNEEWCEITNNNSVFNSKNLFDILDNAIVMNMYFFNTKKETDLYSMCRMEQMNCCRKKTIELIEIINPEIYYF